MSGDGPWRSKVDEVLHMHGGTRQNGKVSSNKTRKQSKEVIYNFFRTLYRLGYKVQDPKNVGERHVEAVIGHWWHEKQLKAKTMEGYASRIRIFFGYLKKPICEDYRVFLPDVPPEDLVVRAAARESKSWAANGIDYINLVREADADDWRMGLMLRLLLAFGLRRKEALLCNPWRSDCGTVFRVYSDQGKNGRERDIPIETEVQRQIIEMVKARIGPTQVLGWELTKQGKLATFEYNERRYSEYMQIHGITKALIGVTGHGLRAQFAENSALTSGFIPPVMGGSKNQLPADVMIAKRAQVSQKLGHKRIDITAAYYGSFVRADIADPAKFRKVIEEAVALLRQTDIIKTPTEDRRDDCVSLLTMVLFDDIELRASEAYSLWVKASERFGVKWMKPTEDVRYILQGTAFDVINSAAMQVNSNFQSNERE